MPIYEYECGLCHFNFERKQGFDEEPVAICPRCRGEARRIFQAAPVIFKGSGFYITDNRKGSASEETKEGKPDKGEQKEK